MWSLFSQKSSMAPLVQLLLLTLGTSINQCFADKQSLSRRVTIPAPLAIPPAQNWEGVDGLWNTFALQIGSPAQTVRVLISTANQQTLVVAPIGCGVLNQSACDAARGGSFNSSESTTYMSKGTFALLGEANLGYVKPGNIAMFGFDTVKVGYEGEGGPSLQNQIVGAFATYDYPFGQFGINPKPTNYTDFNSPYPSFLTNLRNSSKIPSLSWGYTAGAYYRQSRVQSSLTFGGYDSGRFTANNVTWTLGSDNERDILVVIQSITSTIGNNRPTTLIPSTFTSTIYSYIDSTVPQIWLPVEICDVFAQSFNLTYNSTTDLYHVSDDAHNELLISNPTVTFTLGTQQSGGETVQISLPYAAFDMTAKAPYQGLTSSQRFFPLRRATNNQQYTLGRTFLQEAYLTVDWERRNFFVSQCIWPNGGVVQHLKPITSIDGVTIPTKSSSGGLSGGLIGGIVAIVVVVLAIKLTIVWLCLRRRKRRSKLAASMASKDSMTTTTTSTTDTLMTMSEAKDNVLPKAELDATPRDAEDGTLMKHGVVGSPTDTDASHTWVNPIEADSKERQIFEMPGDYPKMPEADGRQFSEKEAMRAREERYNGVDSLSPVTPVSAVSRPSPVSPHEVFEVIDRTGPRGNPVSPIDGSTGSRTMLFSPLSPLEGTVISNPTVSQQSPTSTTSTSNQETRPVPERKRFSYED